MPEITNNNFQVVTLGSVKSDGTPDMPPHVSKSSSERPQKTGLPGLASAAAGISSNCPFSNGHVSWDMQQNGDEVTIPNS